MLQLPKHFPERLRFYRQAQGLSMHALAQRSGTSRQVIAQWEQGKFTRGPTLQTLTALAEALGVLVSHLTGELGVLEIPGDISEAGTESATRARA